LKALVCLGVCNTLAVCWATKANWLSADTEYVKVKCAKDLKKSGGGVRVGRERARAGVRVGGTCDYCVVLHA
jgi:hypothetical protein